MREIDLRSDTVTRPSAEMRAAMAEAEPDIVIHMAAQALVRPSYEEPVETFATNVMGTVHVLEAVDPASAILEFAEVNHVDHLIVGARQDSMLRTLLGSVSAKVAAEAACTVTVVRPQRLAELARSENGGGAVAVADEAHSST